MTACSSPFFFKAEDGIRCIGVTGVQTCALPISLPSRSRKLFCGLFSSARDHQAIHRSDVRTEKATEQLPRPARKSSSGSEPQDARSQAEGGKIGRTSST